jgi:HD-GYP domain-containing protein (c-di-GMP phosphodiesterase class II)
LAEWAVRVARRLGIEEEKLYQYEVAALLHDIGKIGVPDAILKKPSKLTDEERAIMNKHPEYSWSILRLFPGLEEASLFALHHHESFDGNGYPGGLKAEEIPLGSRIVSIVDAFDAMISNRCYRKGLDHQEAIRRLNAGSGTQFDPSVLRCFLEIAELEVAGVFAATGTSITAVI